MEGRSYFWKMAAVCVLVSAVLLTGCGGTGSPAADDPGFDERIFGTWEVEFTILREVWEFRRDLTILARAYRLEDGSSMGSQSLTFTANADIFILVSAEGIRLYYRFSLPDANTLVGVFFRLVTYDDAGTPTIHERSDEPITLHRVTQ